ncbi:hypothetical protein PSE_1295 [Pseudovibrio sp. FO-BEG1]|nr:hypothetical protein PSE_1295 [Pseudovibrio sp. FO-BEG1]EEA92100.1 hypothetical protein PJE062_1917 [Pseudovibrio sp. JE062]
MAIHFEDLVLARPPDEIGGLFPGEAGAKACSLIDVPLQKVLCFCSIHS